MVNAIRQQRDVFGEVRIKGEDIAFDPSRLIPITENFDNTNSLIISDKRDKGFDPSKLRLVDQTQAKLNEEAFDDVKTEDEKASTALQEAVATFEKQGAFLGLLANGLGLIDDESVAPFVAERSKALHKAQQNAPEYVKRFQKEFESAKGFWESAGVVISNPRAIGRLIVTQTPNSALPLALGLAGGTAGSVVPFVGNIAGFATGTFTGGAMVETGAWIDQEIQKRGIDITDPDEVLKILKNDKFMKEIIAEAGRKGLSTAAVDTLFTLFGGRLLSGYW
jgi:hypothetical protein